jgi:hypothetical protein
LVDFNPEAGNVTRWRWALATFRRKIRPGLKSRIGVAVHRLTGDCQMSKGLDRVLTIRAGDAWIEKEVGMA